MSVRLSRAHPATGFGMWGSGNIFLGFRLDGLGSRVQGHEGDKDLKVKSHSWMYPEPVISCLTECIDH